MVELKQILLDYDLCIENEFLDKYLDLIKNNMMEIDESNYKTYFKEHKLRESHHVIPVSYYYQFVPSDSARKYHEALNFANYDSNNFEVELKVKDHLLAHCYLALCSKYLNAAVGHASMLNLNERKLSRKDLEELSKEEAYIRVRGVSNSAINKLESLPADEKLKENSKFTSENNPNANKTYLHKGTEFILVSKDEIDNYLLQGWHYGKTSSQRCYVNKDGIYKNIKAHKLLEYLEEGWSYGASGKPRYKNTKNNEK